MADGSVRSSINRSTSTGTSSVYTYDDGLMNSDDALTAEFRHRIGLLPEEEQDLTEAFKARIGLSSSASSNESSREVCELEMSLDVEKEATLSKFKFAKFVKDYFEVKDVECFTKEPFRQALLSKTKDVDKLASVVISLAIKRFCGDTPTPTTPPAYPPGVPVMTTIYSTMNAIMKRTNGGPHNATDDSKGSTKPAKRSSLKEKLFGAKPARTPSTAAQTSNFKKNPAASDLDLMIANIPILELELVQFIIGHGILKRDLRDEIYCQLCCQVTKNPSIDSTYKGWMLQILCVGCFLPSTQLLKHYLAFLSDAPSDAKVAATIIKRLLYRTNSFGLRYHPPNWLEYKATKMRKNVMLPVSLPDGRCESIESDSAMTASEMCHKIATNLGLKDQFGFAVYISIFDKVSSLGNGADHVMDAIAECEQLVRSSGGREDDAPWQLFFRKEIFTPWHDAELDPVATQLIYRQIVQSVQSEEYRLRSDDEVARFSARRWYIEMGETMDPLMLQTSIKDFVPKSLLTVAKRDLWIEAIASAFERMAFVEKKVSRDEIKWSIVDGAQRKWPIHFAGLFEAFLIAGPPLPKCELVLAVSCKGIFLLDEPYQVLSALNYYEIVDAAYSKHKGEDCVSVITIRGEEWLFASPNAETITKLLATFLDGLRRRSRWAVAIQEFILQDNTSSDRAIFRLMQGDVVELMDETQQQHLKEDWMYGRSERSDQCGSFPYDCVYIFPTCEKPPADFLSMFSAMSTTDVKTLPRKRGAVVLASQTIGRHAGHGVHSAA